MERGEKASLPSRALLSFPSSLSGTSRLSRSAQTAKQSVFFFSKSVKKSVKRDVRVLRERSVRASHARLSRSLFAEASREPGERNQIKRAGENGKPRALGSKVGEKRSLCQLMRAWQGQVDTGQSRDGRIRLVFAGCLTSTSLWLFT